MPSYDDVIAQPRQMLTNLKDWLAKAQAWAEERGFDREVLLQARLAPNQWTLMGQIQGACDNAKVVAARLAGKIAPSHPDTEKTWDEALARIDKVLAFLDTFQAEDFAGSDERKVELPFFPGMYIHGGDYYRQFGAPNQYFHLTTAYSILRHNGVALGKRDFIAHMNMHKA